MSGNGYRYTGQGERYRGVPARDITQEEYDRLGPLEQRTVHQSGAYEAIVDSDITDLKLDELKAIAIDAGADAEVVSKMRAKAEVIAVIDDLAQPGDGEGGS